METITLTTRTKYENRFEMKDVYNKDYKDYCCVYNRDIITEDIKEELAKMRKSEIKLFEPHFISYGFKDEDKKYPIYHYLKSDIKILKNHLLLIDTFKNEADIYNDKRFIEQKNDNEKLLTEINELKSKLNTKNKINYSVNKYNSFINKNSKLLIPSSLILIIAFTFFIYNDIKTDLNSNGLKNNIIYKNYLKNDIKEVETLIDKYSN